jgi:hypothetical protein
MTAGQFVAQHHGASQRVGSFSSWTDATTALDELDDGSWQGIRNLRTEQRWWREGGEWIAVPRRG